MLLKCTWAVMSKIKESICRRSGSRAMCAKNRCLGFRWRLTIMKRAEEPQRRRVMWQLRFLLDFQVLILKLLSWRGFCLLFFSLIIKLLDSPNFDHYNHRLLFRSINTAPIKTINDKLVSNCIVSQCNSVSFLMDIEIRKKHFFKFFPQEKMFIMDSYQRKAGITTKMLNSLKGVSCNAVTGSLYAFPKVILPQKAIEEAKVSCWRSSLKLIVSLSNGAGR